MTRRPMSNREAVWILICAVLLWSFAYAAIHGQWWAAVIRLLGAVGAFMFAEERWHRGRMNR